MSKLATYTIANRPSASSNAGLMIFRTDTNNFEISDGTDWQTYLSDGVFNYFGNNSYSASFDGTDDYVSIGVPLASELTFCAWIKPTANTGYAPVIAAGSNTYYNVSLNYSNGAVTFQSRAGGNPAYASSAILSLNVWSHIAATLDSSGLSVIYINGSSEATSTTQQTPNASSKANPRIGMTPRSDNSSRFTGYIDEVAIFNRAITASEIQDIYNNKTYQNPQAMYRFENNFNDEFGSYNGTQSGGVTFSTDKPY